MQQNPPKTPGDDIQLQENLSNLFGSAESIWCVLGLMRVQTARRDLEGKCWVGHCIAKWRDRLEGLRDGGNESGEEEKDSHRLSDQQELLSQT